MKIALLEDEEHEGKLLREWLHTEGHEVEWLRSGPEMIVALRRRSFDLMLIDWMVPEIDGEKVLAWAVRNLGGRPPAIFLTAVNDEGAVARVLTLGADDYIVKPPRRRELLARIDAVMRRAHPGARTGRVVEVGRYRIDASARRVEFDGAEVVLTAKEGELALFLFDNMGRLLSRDHLLRSVWGLGSQVATRTIDTHMSSVRRKLKLVPENGFRIVSIYGVGYRLEQILDGDGN
jgi:two-component system response regulator RegX3